jgi:tRNA A-37 threonylcarbamoyl transferase component Bud32
MRRLAPKIERYEIIREVGSGGMATVHLARHLALDRLVALKELHAVALDDPQQVERFLREARIGANLTHPNIVVVFDCFEQDGVPFIAMEYLPRGSLREVQGSLTPAQIAGVLEGVLAGLGEAARHGVVHRDLKPENLLISDQGVVKIADFGIAKAIGQTSPERSLTATGTAMGTPAYMAPEQALGAGVGAATDLYSVGVIAFELLTGAPLFEATTTPYAVVMKHVSEPPPDPRERAPGLDDELADATLALLAKHPEDRPDDPAAAWAVLEPIFVRLLGEDWRAGASLVLPPPQTVGTAYVTYEPPLPARPPLTEQSAEVTAAAAEPETEVPAVAHAPLLAAIDPPDAVEPETRVSEIEVDAGGETTLSVRIRNEGETVAHYDVAVTGIPAGWWTATPSLVYLNPWGKGDPAEQTVVVAFRPPRTPDALARRWPVTVTVRERADESDMAGRNVQQLDVGLTIRPFAQLEAALHPQEPHGRRAHFDVRVRNRGNAPLRVALSADDAEGACAFRIPQGASADAGADGNVPVTIAPRRPRWFGRPVLRRFEVTVSPDAENAAAARLPGLYHEHARFPWWVPRLLLLALLAAAAVAGALIGLRGQPTTRIAETPTPTAPATATAGPVEPTVTVPNVVGLALARARTRLEDAGLELGTVRPADLPIETPVKRQDPDAATDVEEGSAVDLFLETVKVPSLRGLTLTEARSRLSDVGLAEGALDPSDAGLDHVVRGQDPPAGERVAPDSEIDLQLGEPAPPPFVEADALEVAQFAADGYAAGNDATADTCEPLGGDRWSCSATISYLDATGTPGECTIALQVTPSDDFSAYTTQSGRAGIARVTDDSDCRGAAP